MGQQKSALSHTAEAPGRKQSSREAGKRKMVGQW